MTRKRQEQLRRETVEDSPVYWFSRYESAILKDNQDEAKRAQARLERLGYAVAIHHVLGVEHGRASR